jgi:hypothetical protein
MGAGTDLQMLLLLLRLLQLSLLILLLAVLWPLWPCLRGADRCQLLLWLSLSSLRFPSHRALAVGFRVSEKRRARSRCRVFRSETPGWRLEARRGFINGQIQGGKVGRGLDFCCLFGPLHFYGRGEGGAISPHGPGLSNVSGCAMGIRLEYGPDGSAHTHSARYLYLGAGEITTPSASFQRFPNSVLHPGFCASQPLAAPESLGKTWGSRMTGRKALHPTRCNATTDAARIPHIPHMLH